MRDPFHREPITDLLAAVPMTTSTDPALNAAVTTTIIDAYSGVTITLTGAGNAQTLQDPTDTTAGKRFTVVVKGAFDIEVNGITMTGGEAQRFIWDGASWVAVIAVDADDITFTPTGDLVSANLQAVPVELNNKKADKGANSDITSTTALTQITRATGGAFDIAIGGAAGDDFTVGTNKLVVEGDSGNVGIGTTAPGVKLQINKAIDGGGVTPFIKLDGSSGTTGDGAAIDFTSGASGEIGARIAGIREGDGADGALLFYTRIDVTGDLDEKMRIDNGGNVGINTTTPGGKLCVNGGVTVGSDTDAGDNNLRVEGIVIGSHDDITATSSGIAASIVTETTFVTTNGDSDLDNVTLADGIEGQVKYICCVVEGNAADTWKITPANMVGGTQITFAGIGEGCILKMYSAGWIVVGNNGGVIS